MKRTVLEEINLALELLDNVTASDADADSLGQAELALQRAREKCLTESVE